MSARCPEERLARLNQVVQEQISFLHRIPDPDTRERAEGHLFELVEMRERAACELSEAGLTMPVTGA